MMVEKNMDTMGAIVACTVMAVYAFTVSAPYLLSLPDNADLLEIIKSNKSTVDLITTAVVMFYFGASVGRRKDQDSLNIMAHTAKQAQEALPVDSNSTTVIPIASGEAVTVKAEDEKL